MKRGFTRRAIAIFILLFIVLSLVTLVPGSKSDGNDLIGFPFRFYIYLGGKIRPEPLSRFIISYPKLIFDLLIIGIASVCIEMFIQKRKRT
ncbi:MAG: hypothetical protein ACTHJT_16265 [Cytophaga sp.]|uniref:hypothetical protein n=1 Tax=Cytophaga sp. TaxID=29535 RepID=UPI003F811D5F